MADNQRLRSPVPKDVHLWTCITCMKSVAMATAVVHTLGKHLRASSLFIALPRNSRLMWRRNTQFFFEANYDARKKRITGRPVNEEVGKRRRQGVVNAGDMARAMKLDEHVDHQMMVTPPQCDDKLGVCPTE